MQCGIYRSSSWSYDKTDDAQLFTLHSDTFSLGSNVNTWALPSCWHFNLGTTYLNVALTTTRHLYNVHCAFTATKYYISTHFTISHILLGCQCRATSEWIHCTNTQLSLQQSITLIRLHTNTFITRIRAVKRATDFCNYTDCMINKTEQFLCIIFATLASVTLWITKYCPDGGKKISPIQWQLMAENTKGRVLALAGKQAISTNKETTGSLWLPIC